MLLPHSQRKAFYCQDVGPKPRDPTGTEDLRKRYRAMATLRWQGLRRLARDAIVGQDMLGLNKSAMGMAALFVGQALGLGGTTDTKIKSFQLWFDNALAQVILERGGGWLQPMTVTSYDRGVKTAQSMVRNDIVPADRSDKIAGLQSLAYAELQGIVEAVSQRAVREVSFGVLNGRKPIQVFRAIADAVDKVGVTRTRAMIDMMIVKNYNQGTLDQFKASKVTQVALVPEWLPPKPKRTRDANPYHDPVSGEFTGPGAVLNVAADPHEEHLLQLSYLTRAAEARARITQQVAQKGEAFAHPFTAHEQYKASMLLKQYRKQDARKRTVVVEEEPELVEVLTAGDDDVCPECEGISEDGPYDIDDAYDLIPAHPHCRCAFVPFGDRRFASVRG
jgi:hypothetical protein